MEIKRIVFSDETYQDLSGKYKTIGNKLHEGIDNFIKEMTDMTTSKYIEGTTASAINDLRVIMQKDLTPELKDIMTELSGNTTAFIEDMVAADKFEYELQTQAPTNTMPFRWSPIWSNQGNS